MTLAALSAHMQDMEALTAPQQIIGDTIARLALAQSPDAESQTLWQLIDDTSDTVANTARCRLGLALRPITPVHTVHIPILDPVTGRVVRP